MGTRARDHQIIQEAAHDYSSSHRRRRQEGMAAAEERERYEGFGWHGADAVLRLLSEPGSLRVVGLSQQ